MKSSLYVLQCEEFFKVGISKTLASRFSTISNATPFSVDVVHVIDFELHEDTKTAEKIAHQQLLDSGQHVKLEWFKGPKLTVIQVCEQAAEIAKHKGRLRKSTIEAKAMHILAICKSDVVEKLTGIPHDRIIDVLGGSQMQEHELLKINTLWDQING
jgi:hypothetical protein